MGLHYGPKSKTHGNHWHHGLRAGGDGNPADLLPFTKTRSCFLTYFSQLQLQSMVYGICLMIPSSGTFPKCPRASHGAGARDFLGSYLQPSQPQSFLPLSFPRRTLQTGALSLIYLSLFACTIFCFHFGIVTGWPRFRSSFVPNASEPK